MGKYLKRLAEYSPALLLISTIVATLIALVQPDLRGISNCGAWKAPACIEKEVKKTVNNNELWRAFHTISVQNYGKRPIGDIVLEYEGDAYFEVQKNDEDPLPYIGRKSIRLGTLRPNKDIFKIKIWANAMVSDHTEFEIKQDPTVGTETAHIQCKTPVTATAAMVNGYPHVARITIMLFVSLFCGYFYLWLRSKFSKG